LIDQSDDRSLAGQIFETLGVFFGRLAPHDGFGEQRVAQAVLGFRIQAIEGCLDLDRHSDGN
jgi:hypothetical protein